MNSGEIMVVTIVAIVMLASILKTIFRGPRHPVTFQSEDPQLKAENRRLREEVQQLKERMQVIERITVEKENSLSKQIEELRDR